MYDGGGTIVAVSSAGLSGRVVVRLSGGRAFDICRDVLDSPCDKTAGITHRFVKPAEGICLEAAIYTFVGPASYTGQDTVEIHIQTNRAVVQALLERLLAAGARMAGPGEFTARAYLNGKIDLSQAEAVNEIISSSNDYQLQAAQKLLQGGLSSFSQVLGRQLLECLSLLEAGLDFSQEDIEFISAEQASAKLQEVLDKLHRMQDGAISFETVMELPSVAIAGAPNAGKSSLLNALLGSSRSIVSHQRHTTRDVLTAEIELEHQRCVLFDCAGLVADPAGVLERLAQSAALQALAGANLVIFCVDLTKDDISEDRAVRQLLAQQGCSENIIALGTKADLSAGPLLQSSLTRLAEKFGTDFTPVSSADVSSLQQVRKMLDEKLLCRDRLAGHADQSGPWAALTARHRQAVAQAIDNLAQAIAELGRQNDEIAAMFIRSAYQAIGSIESRGVEEQLLDTIFGKFCIGK